MQAWSPKNLADALDVLAAHQDDVTLLAGGTDLMVFAELGMIQPKCLLNLWGVPELRGITEEDNFLVIGATTSYTDIIHSPLVQRYLPTLVESARLIGAVQIQNRGTLGGNLGNASPAADTPPVLMAAGGSVRLASTRGRRDVDLDAFFTGYRQIERRPDELIVEIRCRKKTARDHDWFHKVGTRRAQAISKVVMGGRARWDDDGTLLTVRLAAGSVAATTIRMPATEAVMTGRTPNPQLIDEAAQTAYTEVAPIDDVRSTAQYRAQVTANLVKRWIRALIVVKKRG